MAERRGTKALELWCKRLVKDCPEVNIDNMTTSWRNGLAFCALVHHFRPDLIDMTKLKPDNIYYNNQLAFSLAEKHLGIPSLLDPEDMVENEIPDRLSILTYLSQFYQRLGHTANVKVNENDSVSSGTSNIDSDMSSFGKSALDKCVVCGLPVYLAQRLIVSHKLYHRRCYRCSQCAGHLDPNKFGDGNDFICASCKTDKPLKELLNNNDVQMGMLAFHDEPETCELNKDLIQQKKITSDKQNIRPKSILEKINMFERNSDVDVVDFKFGKLNVSNKIDTSKDNNLQQENSDSDNERKQVNTVGLCECDDSNIVEHNIQCEEKDIIYRSDDKKNTFLQAQLCNDSSNLETKMCVDSGIDLTNNYKQESQITNITDELRLSKTAIDSKDYKSNDSSDHDTNEVNIQPRTSIDETHMTPGEDKVNVTNLALSKVDVDEISETCGNGLKEASLTPGKEDSKISVPPRRKKIAAQININKHNDDSDNKNTKSAKSDDYPEELNPFSDDDDEDASEPTVVKPVSTNPFGSDDEEDDVVPEIPSVTKTQDNPVPDTRRLIKAYNPFWSDGEEPSSDEEQYNNESSSMTTSTPNLVQSGRRRKKPAPPPPLIHVSHADDRMSSTDDLASLSSVSSYNSAAFHDQRSVGRTTPLSAKKRAAPTPVDNVSLVSGYSRGFHGDSMEHSLDSTGKEGRRVKGPAPGLPLPSRREVRLQVSPAELQTQLDLLDAQQTGLERQGVLIEQMIRDKCEGDQAAPVPQEEVEDLVIQLCELVNEKNDLFRKQTELMYIRRQQRLEQEQADIEHEIRVIQSRPAVNRIDADKVREEFLVNRLVEIVRLRDELVQSMDAERRREQQEDLAIAASIATKRAQRNDSNASLKSADSTAPKKNKVKDKMKKQFKKAKHSLIPKKKDVEHTEKKLADKSNKE